jgi:hypothetical protein
MSLRQLLDVERMKSVRLHGMHQPEKIFRDLSIVASQYENYPNLLIRELHGIVLSPDEYSSATGNELSTFLSSIDRFKNDGEMVKEMVNYLSVSDLIECDDFFTKCRMKHCVRSLLRDRRMKWPHLGRLGGCVFQHVDEFLEVALAADDDLAIMPAGVKRVVSLGDAHGDLLSLLASLHIVGVIDDNCRWVGESTIVILCGDLIDRGGRPHLSVDTSHNPREEVDIFQFLFSLNTSAHKSGGMVMSTVGNHELGRVWGVDGRNKHLCSDYVRRYDDMQTIGWGGSEHREVLWRPGGAMSLYIARFMPLIANVKNLFIFMHGGIDLHSLANASIAEANLELVIALQTNESTMPKVAEAIAWDRGLSAPNPSSQIQNMRCVQMTQQLFAKLGLDWSRGGIVVGHTIQPSGVPQYCDGKVWRVDLGASEAFGRDHGSMGGIEINIYSDMQPTIVKTLIEYAHDPFMITRTYVNGEFLEDDRIDKTDHQES